MKFLVRKAAFLVGSGSLFLLENLEKALGSGDIWLDEQGFLLYSFFYQ